jgi:hypothetical protein
MSNAVEQLFKGAPEDATHARGHNSGVDYYKREHGKWLYAHCGHWKLAIGTSEADCIERPKQATWSGPQDGLPPVGMKIEYRLPSWSCWIPVTILAYGETRLFVKEDGEPNERTVNAHGMLYRAILTEDQLAAEQRETAIREIMDIADVDCRVTAARLVDAGFKREVV